MDLKTPTEVWSKLHEEFAIKFPNLFLRATEELDTLKLQDNGDFDIHIAKFNASFTKMHRIHSEITKDEEKQVHFIRSLPQAYKQAEHARLSSSAWRLQAEPEQPMDCSAQNEPSAKQMWLKSKQTELSMDVTQLRAS